MKVRFKAVACSLMLSACAVRGPALVPRLPTPLPTLPTPHAGQGVVLVDNAEGPTQVSLKGDDKTSCTTPCALALPLGTPTLLFKTPFVGESAAEDSERGRFIEDSVKPLVLRNPQVLIRRKPKTEVLKPVRLGVARAIYLTSIVTMGSAGLVAFSNLFIDNRALGKTAGGMALGSCLGIVVALPLTIGTTKRTLGADVQFPLSLLRR
jgi:hypothetical protein